MARYSREPRAVRREDAGVDAGRDRRAHELELDAGQHGGEDPALPPRRVSRDVLGRVAQDDDARGALLAEEARDARVEGGGDAVEDEDGRHLATALDGGEHAAADPGPPGDGVEREAPAQARRPDPGPELRHVEPRREPPAVISVDAIETRWWMIFHYGGHRKTRPPGHRVRTIV